MTEEDDRLFRLATWTISEILQKKSGGQVIDRIFMSSVLHDLQKLKFESSLDQKQLAGAAIIVSARVVLPRLSLNEKAEVCQFYKEGLFLLTTFEGLPDFRWKTIEPLFHMYLEAIPQCETAIMARDFFNMLVWILEKLAISPTVCEDLYSFRSCITIGRVFHNVLEIMGKPNLDLILRKTAVNFLSRIIRQCPPGGAPVVSLFVSGLLGGVTRIMTQKTTNASVITDLLAIFKNAVLLTFSNGAEKFDETKINLEDYPTEMHYVFKNQNEEWKEARAGHIKHYLEKLLTLFVIHRNDGVRFEMCEAVIEIQEQCGEVIGEELYGILLSMHMHLKYDDFEKFRKISEHCLALVDSKRIRDDFFYKQLDLQITRLPVETRSGNGSRSLSVLAALLDGLGPNIRLMCTSGSQTMELLLRSLADSIEINLKQLMIIGDVPLNSVSEAMQRYKLMHNINSSQVECVCEMLARHGGIEIIAMVQQLIKSESPKKQSTYHVLLGHLLGALNPENIPSDDPIVVMLAEYMIKETNRSCLIRILDDSKPHTTDNEMDVDMIIESLSLINLALCMRFTKKNANRTHISTECLCTILIQTNSKVWIVQEAAAFALKVIAVDSNQAVTDLISMYSSHILNRVSVACSSSINYHLAPVLMIAYLQNGQVSYQFDVIKVIVEKMLYALDTNKQKYTYSLLRALNEFMFALNKDYPDHQPLPPMGDPEEDQKDRPTPQHILVEKILLRTKHMLSTDHLPVQLLCLELLKGGLELLKHYDDMLLPMIHQNWAGLMTIAGRKDPNSFVLMLDVVVFMAELSGDFVHNKILKELYPLVKANYRELMSRGLSKNTPSYESAKKTIKSIPRLIVYSKMSEEDAKKTYYTLLDESDVVYSPLTIYRDAEKYKMDQYFESGEISFS
ncbi:hypothetical protein L3Y34_005133 [Caenorhabditis briggsae]|uniref:TTI1 C-terminal TPR domain-containing protein n=2 Tax=Caenorhabditis briggsae TaxID=6238 RepID=A0AAE9D5V5_CAEBR|nr:hypothetical protein L3Y34_005133 [Caenorhabditis briggsae]